MSRESWRRVDRPADLPWEQPKPRWELADRLAFMGVWVGGFLILWMGGRTLWALIG